jgi:hypothetical protein
VPTATYYIEGLSCRARLVLLRAILINVISVRSTPTPSRLAARAFSSQVISTAYLASIRTAPSRWFQSIASSESSQGRKARIVVQHGLFCVFPLGRRRLRQSGLDTQYRGQYPVMK